VATAIDGNGDLACAPDASTTYGAGTGLSLVGGTFNVVDARYKPTCPAAGPLGQTLWTGTVCISVVENFAQPWLGAMFDCANGFYGPHGRLPTYTELVSAASRGLIVLTAGEHTADLAGDNSVVFINGTNPNDADGVRARTVSGTAQRCVYAPVATALGSP
jgi:hypothetical protein